jgi:hypothetical protein
VTYAGAATQMLSSSGLRPADDAASRTALMVHSAIDRSASCRMKPSPTSPVSANAFGPYAATQTSNRLPVLQGKRSCEPL